MKKALIFFMFLFSFKGFGQNKPCAEVEITDLVIRKIIIDYAGECVRENFFKENIGAVEMIDFVDTTGRRRIHLSALIDDRYKEAPPTQFADVNGNLVLIYKGDSNGNKIPASPSEELLDCLSKAVGKQLYLRPVHQPDRYFDIKDFNGKVEKRKAGLTIHGGNVWNEITYIFSSPTEYTTLRSL
ncbi:hypothetical protein [Larkinella soli]|uniref:hypothetical protein n=1 Tax=Larkinella soli TaxID=1770527 RepID=UPI000FFB3BDE|nr:hypothetical protein [Larkinella soli]